MEKKAIGHETSETKRFEKIYIPLVYTVSYT
jgi:hypothetical protein